MRTKTPVLRTGGLQIQYEKSGEPRLRGMEKVKVVVPSIFRTTEPVGKRLK